MEVDRAKGRGKPKRRLAEEIADQRGLNFQENKMGDKDKSR